MSRPRVYLVPHTHWDREWYEPFQRFRARLVVLLDEVLRRAESDAAFRFTFDGQLAVIDDYLEIRPENRERIVRGVRAGQFAIGPWQILLDEFLVSGENIVRNLEAGFKHGADLGGVMNVGYLPDEFGHCAQMPQILESMGVHRAVVWRGVPSTVDWHRFVWRAPNGSEVVTEYLPDGYGNARHVFDDPKDADVRLERLVEKSRNYFGTGPLLAMYGGDHAAPLPDLVEVARSLEGVRLATLAEYIADGDAAAGSPSSVENERPLPVVTGELRSHARANILPGVLSARIPIKQAMAAAERMLERYAEPWTALWASNWPQRLLELAWSKVIAASGHDSVTGCGADETALQVLARIREAGHIASAIRDQVCAELAARTASDAFIVVNPSPHPRTDLVEIETVLDETVGEVAAVHPDGRRLATQLVRRRERLLARERRSPTSLPHFLRKLHGTELLGRTVHAARVDAVARRVVFEVGDDIGPVDSDAVGFDPEKLRATLEEAARGSTEEWTVEVLDVPRCSLLAQVAVGPLGWSQVRLEPSDAEVVNAVRPVERGLDNGLIHVVVEDDGTLTLRSAEGVAVSGVGRLVDGGDRGDSYNFAPPGGDMLVDAPDRVLLRSEEYGPLRGRLVVERRYHWPRCHDRGTDRRSSELVAVWVRTVIELRAGERFVRLRIEFDNPCCDHRVRLHLPLPWRVDHTDAEGQFAVVSRGLTAEGGYGEYPIPTYPAHGFVDAGGLAVLLEHPSEYEVVAEGGELALTLLRSVGWLSRNDNPQREDPAGPELPIPEAQCRGPVAVTVGIVPHRGSWVDADLVRLAEEFRLPMCARRGSGPNAAALHRVDGIFVDGRGVVMSALRRVGDELELRVVAESPHAVTAQITGVDRVRRCTLAGTEIATLGVMDGTCVLSMQPWEIATLRLAMDAGRAVDGNGAVTVR